MENNENKDILLEENNKQEEIINNEDSVEKPIEVIKDDVINETKEIQISTKLEKPKKKKAKIIIFIIILLILAIGGYIVFNYFDIDEFLNSNHNNENSSENLNEQKKEENKTDEHPIPLKDKGDYILYKFYGKIRVQNTKTHDDITLDNYDQYDFICNATGEKVVGIMAGNLTSDKKYDSSTTVFYNLESKQKMYKGKYNKFNYVDDEHIEGVNDETNTTDLLRLDKEEIVKTDKNNDTKHEPASVQNEQNNNADNSNSDLITDLMKIRDYTLSTAFNPLAGVLYNQDYTNNTLPNEIKILFGLRTFENNDWGKDCDVLNPCVVTIEGQDFDKAMKKLFGNQVIYENQSIKSNSLSYYMNVEYTNNSYILKWTPGWGGTGFPWYENKITSTEQFDNKIEIVEKVAYIEAEYKDSTIVYNVYSTIDENNAIETLDNFQKINIDNYLEKLASYKYTFNKDENGNYYFYSIEKVD